MTNHDRTSRLLLDSIDGFHLCIFFHFVDFLAYIERKNLTEKGLRLALVSNTTVVDINSRLLTEKTFKWN